MKYILMEFILSHVAAAKADMLDQRLVGSTTENQNTWVGSVDLDSLSTNHPYFNAALFSHGKSHLF